MLSNTRSRPPLINAEPVTKKITDDLNKAEAKIKEYLDHLTVYLLNDGHSEFIKACNKMESGKLLTLAAAPAPSGEQLNSEHTYIGKGKEWNAPIHFQKFTQIDSNNLMLKKIAETSKLSDRMHALKESFGYVTFGDELIALADFINSTDMKNILPTPRRESTRIENTDGSVLLAELNKLLENIKAQYALLLIPHTKADAEKMLLDNLRVDVRAYVETLPASSEDELMEKKITKSNTLLSLLTPENPSDETIADTIEMIKSENFKAAIKAEHVSNSMFYLFSTTPSVAFLNRITTEVNYHEQRMALLTPTPKMANAL